jgi:RNA polymerase sigma-70 factor, ECF subfamily
MSQSSHDIFENHRPLLTALAARIVGDWSEAEDLVNEAFLRWNKLDSRDVANPRALLATIVSRLAINHRTSARSRREVTVDPWLLRGIDEPATGETGEMTDALSNAFEIVLSRLSPAERAVFLLREIFQFEYAEVAGLLDESEANCRQILKRARDKIALPEPRFSVSPERCELALEHFLSASRTGNLNDFMAVLAPEVVLARDPEDVGFPLPPPVHGVDALFAHMRAFWEKFRAVTWSCSAIGRGYQVATIHSGEQIVGAFICAAHEGAITNVNHVSCPTRLSAFLQLVLAR